MRSESLSPDEIVVVDGMRVTSVARTAFELGRWLDHDDAVAMIDALCNVTNLPVEAILQVMDEHRGARGLRKLRSVLRLVDGGAESPAETRTRLALVRAGLPTPSTQVHVYDDDGRIIARCDLGWERWRVVVEYDGEGHWSDESSRTRDIRRYAVIRRRGWHVVQVNSGLLRDCPDKMLDEVRIALRAAGADV